ncbi:MAG: nucleotide exchange factor GrpE [Gammaproteobacteria bacterium]
MSDSKDQTAAEAVEDILETAEAEASQEAMDASADGAGGGDDLAGLLEDARSKADEYQEQMVRLQAEMDNLRKRTAREVEQARKFALEGFARELLNVADSMQLGLQAAGEDAEVAALREGVELTLKQLMDVFARFDVREIEAEGARFDPDQHEALSMVPSPEHEPNTVMMVVQKGYLLNERLLRPARVVVSAANS